MPKSSVAFGLGALLLAVGIAGAMLLGGAKPTRSDPVEAVAGAGPVAAAEPDAPPLPSPPSRDSSEAPERSVPVPDFASRRTAAVRGRVVLRGTGLAVGSARITLWTGKNEVDVPETMAALGGAEGRDRLAKSGEFEARLAALGGWKFAHRAESAADGSFEIAVPPDFPRFQIRVAADLAAWRDRETWFALDSPSVRDGLVLELEPAGNVEGTVTNAGGRPAERARVSLVREPFEYKDRIDSVTADASGRFVFRGVPPGRLDSGALAPGSGPQVRSGIDVRAGETTRLEFTLPAECFLAGRVVDESGAGVLGARLNAFLDGDRPRNALVFAGYGSTRSAADGSFRIGSLLPGRHRFLVDREGMLAPDLGAVDVPQSGGLSDLRVVLEKGHGVAGRVVDPAGKPVAAAIVSARPDHLSPRTKDRPVSFSQQSGRSAPDGSFRFAGLAGVPLLVEAQADGLGKAEVRDVDAGAEGIEIVLPGPTGVAGLVREADTGKPVGRFTIDGQRVSERKSAFFDSSEGIRPSTSEKEDGTFERLDLAPGNYDFSFEAEGFVPEVLTRIGVKAGEVHRGLEVLLRRGATVRGNVVARDTGEPVADATVERVEADRRLPRPFLFRGHRREVRTDSRGAFEVKGIEPGAIRLQVSHPSFAEATSDPIDGKGGETVEGILISLSRGGALDGYAIGEGGTPLAGGRVHATPTDDLRERWTPRKESPIDEAGYFRLEGLAPGRYRVEARPPWRKRIEDASAGLEAKASLEAMTRRAFALVEEGRTTRVEFPALPKGGCTVRGRVLRGGDGVEGARVSVAPSSRAGDAAELLREGLNARTGADGSFAVANVPAGSATLLVSPPSSRESGKSSASRQRSIEVPDAPELVLDVTLSGGGIAGRVVRASDGKPLPDVSVGTFPSGLSVSWVPKGYGWAHTNEAGEFRIADLEPGIYLVRAGGGMGKFASGKDEALAGETRDGIEVREGEEVALDFVLSPGGTALVTVRDPAGKAMRGAMVILVPSDAPRGVRKFVGGSQGTTDGDGLARVAGLSTGTYYAAVYGTEYAGAESEEASVRVGSETSFRLDLREGTRVRARVVDGNDAPVGLLPLFVDSRGRDRFAIPPGAPGFRRPGEEGMGIAVLLPGEYTVRIGGEGWKEQTTSLRVGTRSPQDLVLRLERAEKP